VDFAPEALAAKAQRLFALHTPGEPLWLLNAWDAGSARLFEAHGAPAIGTTSAGVAFALGRRDGDIGRAEMLEATGRIVAAVDVPVTADVESGFGESPDDVGETVEGVLAAGAVGINLEDSATAGTEPLRPAAEAAERVAAARAAAGRAGAALFINARTDVYWLRLGDESTRLERTIERLAAYVEAGADGVFAPGVSDPEEITRLVQELGAPLNVLAGPSLPPPAELAALGVARVSSGSGPSRAVLGLAARLGREFTESGGIAAMTEGALAYDEAQSLFAPR
jgi:2-methylisocitrate lyase-like PEP mutase family enzyme